MEKRFWEGAEERPLRGANGDSGVSGLLALVELGVGGNRGVVGAAGTAKRGVGVLHEVVGELHGAGDVAGALIRVAESPKGFAPKARVASDKSCICNCGYKAKAFCNRYNTCSD